MQPVPASVRNWLIVVAAMIFFMIVIGALTRLTEILDIDFQELFTHVLLIGVWTWLAGGLLAIGPIPVAGYEGALAQYGLGALTRRLKLIGVAL